MKCETIRLASFDTNINFLGHMAIEFDARAQLWEIFMKNQAYSKLIVSIALR